MNHDKNEQNPQKSAGIRESSEDCENLHRNKNISETNETIIDYDKYKEPNRWLTIEEVLSIVPIKYS